MKGVRISLVALELDALRETANIATARAACALGALTGRRVWMSVPELHWAPGPWEDLRPGSGRRKMVAVSSVVRGAIAGSLLFLASHAAALEISRIVLGNCREPIDPCHPFVRSSLIETANILGGTYLTALAMLTGGVFKAATPVFTCLPERDVWEDLEKSGEWPVAGLCLETQLSIEGAGGPLPCRFYLLGDQGEFAEMLAGLKAWE